MDYSTEKAPVLMGAAEEVGAIASPTSKLFNISKTAPLGIKNKIAKREAIIGGGIYGVGSSQERPTDYAKNIASSIGGNYLGYGVANKLYGRVVASVGRAIFNEIRNIGTKKIKNLL